MAQTEVEKFTSTDEGMRLFQQEGLILEVTELIYKLMEEKNISKADIAEKLGVSRGHITQLLDGTRNMTLKTVSDIMWVFDYTLHIRVESLNIESKPAEILEDDFDTDWGPNSIKLTNYAIHSNEACGVTDSKHKQVG